MPGFAKVYKEGKTIESIRKLPKETITERISALRKNVASLDKLIWTSSSFGRLSAAEQVEAIKGYEIVRGTLANYENAKFRHLFVNGDVS